MVESNSSGESIDQLYNNAMIHYYYMIKTCKFVDHDNTKSSLVFVSFLSIHLSIYLFVFFIRLVSFLSTQPTCFGATPRANFGPQVFTQFYYLMLIGAHMRARAGAE